ncbi:hypothetical protein H4R35_004532, partial [Dimargaris xerosporica]
AALQRRDDSPKGQWVNILSPYTADSRTKMLDCTTFNQAVQSGGYPRPYPEQCDDFLRYLESEGDIDSVQEAAMFLTQVLWESDGLRHKVEKACLGNKCAGQYASNLDHTRKDGKANQYYGRGYIQLTWAANYLDASKAIFGDERLLVTPDLVITDELTSWRTSFWYWKHRVHIMPEVSKGQFGATTRAINGGLECDGPNQHIAKLRFELYQKILQVIAPKVKPNPEGCYPVTDD